VTAVAGSDFSASANSVRLAFSFASPDQMDEGIARLAAAV
jgi:DNA-binding transcriptional MocR family regulator